MDVKILSTILCFYFLTCNVHAYNPTHLAKTMALSKKYIETGSPYKVVQLGKEELNLAGFDLSEADLSGAYLYHANLSNTVLIGTNLTNAHLADANLTEATLINSNLTGTDLLIANLTNANLTGVTLTNTNLYYANLSGVKGLTKAQKTYAQVHGASNVPADKLARVNLYENEF